MYELSKKILEKVSFDKFLFKKELMKAIQWIREDEVIMLRDWCVSKFGQSHYDVISEAFQSPGTVCVYA